RSRRRRSSGSDAEGRARVRATALSGKHVNPDEGAAAACIPSSFRNSLHLSPTRRQAPRTMTSSFLRRLPLAVFLLSAVTLRAELPIIARARSYVGPEAALD